MSKSDKYRQKVADSERRAVQALDTALKRHHLNLAEGWRMMAERASAQESKPASPSKGSLKKSRLRRELLPG